jgi:thymidylate synthase
MNNLDKQYIDLLKDILENGTQKTDRTGTGTISVFGRQIRHKMSEGFPVLTSKKIAWKSVVTELLWFLKADTNIRYLVYNDCHIWDGDCYQAYLKRAQKEADSEGSTFLPLPKEEFINKIKIDVDFASKWGQLGPIYGKQWRDWNGRYESNEYKDYIKGVDQIKNLINGLKTNPDSRRLMVNSWNLAEIDSMVLPPCHYGFQVYTRELSLKERSFIAGSNHNEVSQNIKMFTGIDEDHTLHKHLDDINIPKRAISLSWNQRSVDTPLGLPFNIASYGLLLEILGRIVNMVPDELIGNLGDTHIYLNQIDGVKEQIQRASYELPKLQHMKTQAYYDNLSESMSLFIHLDPKDFQLENYKSYPKIHFPLSN